MYFFSLRLLSCVAYCPVSKKKCFLYVVNFPVVSKEKIISHPLPPHSQMQNPFNYLLPFLSTFIFEEYFCWIWNSRRIVFFSDSIFFNAKSVLFLSLFPGIYVFGYPYKFIFSFQNVDHGVAQYTFVFILLGISWFPGSVGFSFGYNLENSWLVFLDFFFFLALNPSLQSFWNSYCTCVRLIDTVL